jgi:hypothetical protein
MESIRQTSERPQSDVLAHRRSQSLGRRRSRQRRAQEGERRAKDRSIGQVEEEAGWEPRSPSGDELAEELDVVIGGAEQPLVNRLLGGPKKSGSGSRHGTATGCSGDTRLDV